MYIIGIDPGLTGAIVVLNTGSNYSMIEQQIVMPSQDGFLCLGLLTTYLSIQEDCKVYLEKVHSMPKQGVASSFKFGRVFGAIEGILVALGLDYELVTPQKWQKEVHLVDRKVEPDPKKRSLEAATKLFPGVDMRASDRCRSAHKGIVDALLIAEYGRRQNV